MKGSQPPFYVPILLESCFDSIPILEQAIRGYSRNFFARQLTPEYLPGWNPPI